MASPLLIASVRYSARRRRRIAQNISAFADLIANPEDLGAVAANTDSAVSFLVPADARLAVSLDDVTDPADISLKDGVQQVFGGGGAADFVQRLSNFPRGREVVVHRAAGCPSGACSIYVLDEWMRPFVIATATFT